MIQFRKEKKYIGKIIEYNKQLNQGLLLASNNVIFQFYEPIIDTQQNIVNHAKYVIFQCKHIIMNKWNNSAVYIAHNILKLN